MNKPLACSRIAVIPSAAFPRVFPARGIIIGYNQTRGCFLPLALLGLFVGFRVGGQVILCNIVGERHGRKMI